MRFAMIFGKTHDGKVKVVGGPGLPSELNVEFKKMAADTHPEFSELHFHEMSLSAGRKRMSFRPPTAAETGENGALNDLSLDALKQMAAAEAIDVSGCKNKKDFVNTIAAARRAKTSA